MAAHCLEQENMPHLSMNLRSSASQTCFIPSVNQTLLIALQIEIDDSPFA